MSDNSFWRRATQHAQWRARRRLLHLRRLRSPKVVTHFGVKIPIGPFLSPKVRDHIFEGLYETPECGCLKRHLEPDDRGFELGTGLGFVSTFAALRIGADRV